MLTPGAELFPSRTKLSPMSVPAFIDTTTCSQPAKLFTCCGSYSQSLPKQFATFPKKVLEPGSIFWYVNKRGSNQQKLLTFCWNEIQREMRIRGQFKRRSGKAVVAFLN
jgi:hypothetical protein